jgi:cytochrome P450
MRKAAMTQEKKICCAADAYLANNMGWSIGQHGTNLALFIPDDYSTIAEMMSTMVVYLLNNPQYADDIYKETLGVEGSYVIIKDKPNMPMTEAFINEVLRIVCPFDISGMNRPKKTTQLQGYTIPSNVDVVPYFAGVLFDEKIFPEPHKFNPERFIVNG